MRVMPSSCTSERLLLAPRGNALVQKMERVGNVCSVLQIVDVGGDHVELRDLAEPVAELAGDLSGPGGSHR